MGAYRFQGAEVLQDLQGARLQALAARAGGQGRGAFDEQGVGAAAGEVDREGESGGAGADDQDVGVRGVSTSISLTLLSGWCPEAWT